MKLCSLSSGSKGNTLYINVGDSKVLIDSGLTLKDTVHRMSLNGISPTDIDAIFVTHEHADHIRSVGAFSRRYKTPIYASHLVNRFATDNALFRNTKVVEFESGTPFEFKDVLVDPFPVTHDAVDTVGFLITSIEGRAASVTDLGIVTRLVVDKLIGCKALNIEFNHDVDMLMDGPYPWYLKQRIKSRHGHLANEDSLRLLGELIHDRLELVIIAHMSEINNDPKAVSKLVSTFIKKQNICSPKIILGDQYNASELIKI